MNRDKFLKDLEINLYGLRAPIRKEELQKYENLINYDILDPTEEANKIYEKHKIKIILTNNIKFTDAINTFLKIFKSKNSKEIINLIIFFLISFLFIIIIKIPFNCIRDLALTIFNNIIKSKEVWSIIIEIIYAITSIIYLINRIKRKSYEINKKRNGE